MDQVTSGEAPAGFNLEPEADVLLIDGNQWVSKTRVVYKKVNGNFSVSEKSVYTAAPDGNLLSMEKFGIKNGNLQKFYSFRYDWQNSLLKKVFFTELSGKSFEYRCFYENGHRNKIEIWETTSGQNNLTEIRTGKFRSNGVIEKKVFELFSGGKQSHSVTIFFNEAGNPYYQENLDYSTEIPVLNFKSLSTYDANGFLLTCVNYERPQGEFELKKLDSTFSAYDGSGKILSKKYISEAQPLFNFTWNYSYSQGVNQFLIRKYAYDSNGETWGLKEKDWYHFEGENLISQINEFVPNQSLSEKFYQWDAQSRIQSCITCLAGDTATLIQFSYETASAIGEAAVPDKTVLVTGYPNPFNPTTMLSWQQPHAGRAVISVTTLTGQTLFSQQVSFSAGKQLYPLDLSGYGSGIYFARIEMNGQVSGTLKLVLIK
ncbi:MAG: T9SS type A sorting domain-containing protein [Bacteroidetes bacterium]|nr:T9SS type A sorting domain-containing protein [Bacteroidota bacterium]